jgi:ATP-dependent RNA helicase SUPV3L1/SUV3
VRAFTMPSDDSPRSSLVAVLGPTNTGKTHRAIERMLECESGMFGLPLRLLRIGISNLEKRLLGEPSSA